MPKPLLNRLLELRRELKRLRQRSLLILSGDAQWHRTCLDGLWGQDETVLWQGCAAPNRYIAIEESQLKHRLGQEADSVIIDLKEGFSANGLGIVSGLIRGGGLLVLLMPEMKNWPKAPNPASRRFLSSPYTIEQTNPFFHQHLLNVWQQEAIWLHQHQSPQTQQASLQTAIGALKTQSRPAPFSLPTKAQIEALQAVESVAFGHRKRPLVLSADRGRGKSSLLGLAAIELLCKGKRQVEITASRYEQAAIAFHQAWQTLQDHDDWQLLEQRPGLLSFQYQNQTKTLKFKAPDELVNTPSQADVLMVDEAAHLPTPMLTALLTTHHRLVFATTLHGYEGCGRGFELRFKRQLDRLTPHWKNQHLLQPIRWAEADPLERIMQQSLLLDAEAAEIQTDGSLGRTSMTCQMEPIQPLIDNTDRLKQLFGLLVQAHYQTSPNDLQQLLSAPDVRLFTANWQNQIVGAALCIAEGGLAKTTETRCLHGHLVPQLLNHQYGETRFLTARGWRVMRIAVHPQRQAQGIGRQLLKQIEHHAMSQKLEYLSASFGTQDTLLKFWFQNHYKPLHLGCKRDKASGSYTLVVMRSLTPAIEQACQQTQQAWSQQFPHLLIENLQSLEASLISQLLSEIVIYFKVDETKATEPIQAYLHGHRPYEAISGQLWQWGYRHAEQLSRLSELERNIWIEKIFKKRNWQEVASEYQLAGRKAVESTLKSALSKLQPKS
ncbi:GNAT family N-acetyltransferase [Thiomicrorhabdus sp. zzn3]|uniref:tRNA(Met) cytidine acetyltransferase TmcA n=1 Tax=Thiomicrorhabdus sp. zzn3 TaxID=3039775 RepID=UPI0024372CD1|nr:GNAT family N-acetyltransferase [Thiomicrorhabdus sp. zzn3]MDG6778867.1 GNAT family N-acetyltransferase [Thiomicrorhabdus sp. zzn3]